MQDIHFPGSYTLVPGSGNLLFRRRNGIDDRQPGKRTFPKIEAKRAVNRLKEFLGE